MSRPACLGRAVGVPVFSFSGSFTTSNKFTSEALQTSVDWYHQARIGTKKFDGYQDIRLEMAKMLESAPDPLRWINEFTDTLVESSAEVCPS